MQTFCAFFRIMSCDLMTSSQVQERDQTINEMETRLSDMKLKQEEYTDKVDTIVILMGVEIFFEFLG